MNIVDELKSLAVDISSIKPDPRNARKHPDRNLEAIKKSLQTYGQRKPIVVNSRTGIIEAGNGLYQAAKELGWEKIAAVKVNDDDDYAKGFSVADNQTALLAEWDFPILRDILEELDTGAFDMDATGFNTQDIEDLMTQFHIEEGQSDGDIPSEIKNSVLRNWVSEYIEQLNLLYSAGYCFQGLTKSLAVYNFLRSKYLGVEYPRYCSVIFHKDQIKTKGDKYSLYEGLERIANGKVSPERLMFVLGGELTRNIYTGSLAFAGAKMPLDFPAILARDIINKYSNNGVILDPCHGWGGRLVGYLLSNAEEYTGYDVSPEMNAGTLSIYETLKPYADKKATLLVGSVEKTNYKNNYYDLVFTSPPYYNREKYLGGEQSHLYKAYDEWVDKFLKVLISKSFDSLKEGGIICLQVGSQKYPITNDTKLLMSNVGFNDIETLGTDIDNHFTNTRESKSEVLVKAIK